MGCNSLRAGRSSWACRPRSERLAGEARDAGANVNSHVGQATSRATLRPAMPTTRTLAPVTIALAGLVALGVAMGIGRFAFTPLLPMMLAERSVDLRGASLLASANYLGYLRGRPRLHVPALAVAALPALPSRRRADARSRRARRDHAAHAGHGASHARGVDGAALCGRRGQCRGLPLHVRLLPGAAGAPRRSGDGGADLCRARPGHRCQWTRRDGAGADECTGRVGLAAPSACWPRC